MLKVIGPSWLFSQTQLKKTGDYTLVDARSPGEYRDGHIPGAVNIPLLNDDQRHAVGIVYVKEGRTAAISLGLELISKTIAGIVSEFRKFVEQNSSRVIIYCWRGGMRSRSMGELARALGFSQVLLLRGGYKAYRGEVLRHLDDFSNHRLLVLNGFTGSGKTELLQKLPEDFPFIDFEGMARHRGSAFGRLAMSGEQDISQAFFENLIAHRYAAIRHHKIIVAEIESALGKVFVPNPIRKQMDYAPFVELHAAIPVRAQRLAQIYGESEIPKNIWLRDFENGLNLLKKYLSAASIAHVKGMIERNDLLGAVTYILQNRYDPIYNKGLKRIDDRRFIFICTDAGYEEALDILEKYCSDKGTKFCQEIET